MGVRVLNESPYTLPNETTRPQTLVDMYRNIGNYNNHHRSCHWYNARVFRGLNYIFAQRRKYIVELSCSNIFIIFS